jgi:hypothetical protein
MIFSRQRIMAVRDGKGQTAVVFTGQNTMPTPAPPIMATAAVNLARFLPPYPLASATLQNAVSLSKRHS